MKVNLFIGFLIWGIGIVGSILFLYWYSTNDHSIGITLLLLPISFIAAIIIGGTILTIIKFIEDIFFS